MRTSILLALGLLLTACPPTDEELGFAEADDDDATPDDDDVIPADDDDGDDGLGPGGSFGVWYWELPDPSGSGYQAVSGFNASFHDTLATGEAGVGGVDWGSPADVDECAITTWDAADTTVSGGIPAETEEMDAGVITFTSPNWTVDLEPWDHVGPSQYYFELNPVYDVHFEEFYAVSATGSDFPAFDSVTDLLIPAALHLTAPEASEYFEVPEGDFEVTWDGGSLDEIWIEFHTSDDLTFDNVAINCRADNDGVFSIPGDMTAQFPPGERLTLILHQPRSETFVVDGYELGVGSSASAQSNGERP